VTGGGRTAEVVVCGAGIAGIAAAYHLAVKRGIGRVVLVDERPPLSLTSDKSTEAYRNWWPGPDDAMVRLMNRSIDLLEALAEESGDAFHLNRRGYVYATADPGRAAALRQGAEQAAAQGAGPCRAWPDAAGGDGYARAPARGYRGQPAGADFLGERALVRRHFPCLSEDTRAVVHVRRAGWLSGQQLGMCLLDEARRRGVELVSGRVDAVDVEAGRVSGVRVARAGGEETIATRAFVNAAGPFAPTVARLQDVELPVFLELHLKLAFEDHLGVVPRDAPMLIWDDPQTIAWTDEERAGLQASPDLRFMLDPLPAGAHLRPEGLSPESRTLLVLWACHTRRAQPVLPLPADPQFPELALRGVATMVPGLRAYVERLPRGVVDGGYYTRTRENRCLVGPLGAEGAYIIGALSGYGLMAACAAGELLAAHVTGDALPGYAPAFAPARYADPAYRRRLEAWGDDGQL
jgi:glycine/D-amino acid oxidase-like deaminating enzyme